MNVSGIGPVLADRIISGRPYSSRRDLIERGIVSQSTFEELGREFDERQRRCRASDTSKPSEPALSFSPGQRGARYSPESDSGALRPGGFVIA
jgi:hypothetical protein